MGARTRRCSFPLAVGFESSDGVVDAANWAKYSGILELMALDNTGVVLFFYRCHDGPKAGLALGMLALPPGEIRLP